QIPPPGLGEPAGLCFHLGYLSAAESSRSRLALSLLEASTLCATLGVTSSALCWGQGGMGWSVRDSRWSPHPPWSLRSPHRQRVCRRRPRQVSPSRYRWWSIQSIPTVSPTSESIHRVGSSSAGRPARAHSEAPGSARSIKATPSG